MGFYREIEGDLISLAIQGEFEVIAHGCNCFCKMESGIAPQMAKAFGVDKFPLEHNNFKADFDKLGNIESGDFLLLDGKANIKRFPTMDGRIDLIVVNAYTQYRYGKNHADGHENPLDYEALTLCMRKINHRFKGKHIGLPKIGCGLAGGIWDKNELSDKEFMDLPLNFRDVKTIIKKELKDCDVTIVLFKK